LTRNIGRNRERHGKSDSRFSSGLPAVLGIDRDNERSVPMYSKPRDVWEVLTCPVG
jgi:hypothetical protein